MSLDLDKSTWKRVRLGDVIRRSRKQVDPLEAGVERYVGGGHIDGNSMTVDRWGDPNDGQMGSTFRYVFEPGQILFVSARPYLRKSGVVDFSGVVADKTYVLDAVPENGLLQEFLPFVLASGQFVQYATDEATGSMNPRLLWGPLQRYEFALPPIDEQKRIAALLWGLERHRRALADLAAALTGDQLRDARAARAALLNELLARADETWTRASLGQMGTFTRGRRFTKTDYVDAGIGCIHYGQIYTDYDAVATQTGTFVPEALRPSLRFARPGDLIVAGTSETVDDVCKAVAWMGEGDVAVHDDCFVYTHGLDPLFASYVFASRQFQEQKARFASETKVVRVSATNLAKIVIPVPPLAVQREMVGAVEEFERARDAVLRERAGLDATSAVLLAEIFRGD